jgi:hypothetical protein
VSAFDAIWASEYADGERSAAQRNQLIDDTSPSERVYASLCAHNSIEVIGARGHSAEGCRGTKIMNSTNALRGRRG